MLVVWCTLNIKCQFNGIEIIPCNDMIFISKIDWERTLIAAFMLGNYGRKKWDKIWLLVEYTFWISQFAIWYGSCICWINFWDMRSQQDLRQDIQHEIILHNVISSLCWWWRWISMCHKCGMWLSMCHNCGMWFRMCRQLWHRILCLTLDFACQSDSDKSKASVWWHSYKAE